MIQLLLRHNTTPRFGLWILAWICLAGIMGCESGMSRIDRQTNALLQRTNSQINAEIAPDIESENLYEGDALRYDIDDAEELSTSNPDAEQLQFTPEEDSDAVFQRLEAYGQDQSDVLELDLSGCLAYASEHSRAYRDAEEQYIISALQLLIERHRWGPRFFNETTATISGSGDSTTDMFDTALNVVNEFRVTQRLPYGGEVAATALATATEDLHQFVAGENVQDAALILDANIPLLRGAGLAAREPLIQAERNLIYAARSFERFRREFTFDITRDYLDLVVLAQNIENAKRQVASFEQLEQREKALVDAGRQTPFQAALAEQDTLFARDRLSNQQEQYRLSVDRFKVRLGMETDLGLIIVPTLLKLPAPRVEIDAAVQRGMALRLDLQTQRDQLDDFRRNVDIARNAILPDLDLVGNVTVPTELGKDRAGFDLDVEESSFSAGVTFSAPLDRKIERSQLRQAQLDLEQAIRDYTEFRDNVAVSVRSAVRAIDQALFSLQLQETNVKIADRRIASIEAAPDRASARDRSEAVDARLRAVDDRDAARRDVQVAILDYLLSTGMLRIEADGSIEPLPGMTDSLDRDMDRLIEQKPEREPIDAPIQ